MNDTKQLQQEISEETKKLIAAGHPTFAAEILAASNIYIRRNAGARQSTDAELKAAMASSCIEP